MTISPKTRQLNLRIDKKLYEAMQEGLWEVGSFMAGRGKVTSVNMAVLIRHSVMLTLGLLPKDDVLDWLVRLAQKYGVCEEFAARLKDAHAENL